PAFCCTPRPRDELSTRTPGTPAAISRVPSRLPPSTTTISSMPRMPWSATRCSRMRRASSRTGTTTESRTGSGQRAAAARAGARRGAEAVRPGGDRRARELAEIVDVPHGAGARRTERQLEHLVEVAIVQTAVVADAHEAAAHEAGDGVGVEVVHEQRHVAFRLAPARQLHREAADGHVRDREE